MAEYNWYKHKYLIGQKVIVANDEIGVVVNKRASDDNTIYIRLTDGIEMAFDKGNVRPLPNGQL